MQKTYSLCFPPAFRRNTTSSFVYAGFNLFFFFLNGHAKNIPICHNCSIHSQDHYKLLWQKNVLSCLWLRSSAESGVPSLICGQKVQAPEERLHPAQMPQSPHLPANFTKKPLATGPLLYRGQAFYSVGYSNAGEWQKRCKNRVEAHVYSSLTDFRWHQLAGDFVCMCVCFFPLSFSREYFICLPKFPHAICSCCFVLFLKSLTYIFIIDRYYTLAVKKHCKVLVNFSELTE